ncbi:hypothetical protein TGRH88_087823 [Toxoplasma gondii]|uniref:Uncharacterized protein n=1 Tax=Toxoplasma gondii TaxID=5811 RepID=A0A7J6KA36_TOXGO|nr:hypothetical protein TGRH88_087823 [Toxoplasma gondii]
MGRHLTGSRPAVTLSAVSTMSFLERRSALGILGEVCSERRVRLQLFASLPPHDLRCCLPNGAAAAAGGFGVSEMMGVLATNGNGSTDSRDDGDCVGYRFGLNRCIFRLRCGCA